MLDRVYALEDAYYRQDGTNVVIEECIRNLKERIYQKEDFGDWLEELEYLCAEEGIVADDE